MGYEILSLDDVTYRYRSGDWELRAASFSIKSGEIVGIIGPNGSGKSTLLKIAAGILAPATGNVRLDGKELRRMTRRRIASQLGYLPQSAQSYLDYTVEEVVAMGRFPHLRGAGFLGPHDEAVIVKCMRQTDTERYRRRPINRLSGGERQRVLLASVLAQEPKVLLLDEPTSALDINHQVRFFTVLTDLVRSGMGGMVVTHDINLASLFSQRLLLIKGGKILHQGEPGSILTREILQEAYGEGIEVSRHPTRDRPVVFPSVTAD